MLKFKEFKTPEALQFWANGPDGTEYIISIVINKYNTWVIWYIDESGNNKKTPR